MSDQSWCLTGELELEKAEQLENAIELESDMRGEFPPTVSRFEQPNSNLWKIDIYFASKPDTSFVDAFLEQAHLNEWSYELSAIEERDWVSESQKLLAPVRAGRFLVYGAHDADKADPALINLQVDAGQAFGTGKHETTAACLTLMDKLEPDFTPHKFLDLGTGSGVLALAAAKLWPESVGTASDIDPIATEVAAENAGINKIARRSDNEAGVLFLTADGLNDPKLAAESPYDLLVANILAGPLIEMASDISAAVNHAGILILSGLLITQKLDVLNAYGSCGMICVDTEESGEWAALQLVHAK